MTTLTNLSRLAALSAASALLAAGCGSSSGLSKAQYTAQANAICRATSAQAAPLARRLLGASAAVSAGNPAAVQEATGALQELHTVTSAALAKLRALQQPSAGHAEVERFLSGLTSVTTALGQAATTAAAGQFRQALPKLQTAGPAGQQLVSAAAAYGLTQCTAIFSGLSSTPTASATSPTAATPSTPAVRVALSGESHAPTVNRPWRYTVTVSDAQGHPLSGTWTTHYAYNGSVVGTEKPENVRFTGGVYHDTIEFPDASVGYPLNVQAVVRTTQGTGSAEWPVRVHR